MKANTHKMYLSRECRYATGMVKSDTVNLNATVVRSNVKLRLARPVTFTGGTCQTPNESRESRQSGRMMLKT